MRRGGGRRTGDIEVADDVGQDDEYEGLKGNDGLHESQCEEYRHRRTKVAHALEEVGKERRPEHCQRAQDDNVHA